MMTIYVTQSFFSCDLLKFWRLWYPGVMRLGWWGHTCAWNLPWVVVEVCAKFGGDWFSGSLVKEGQSYTGTKITLGLNSQPIPNEKANPMGLMRNFVFLQYRLRHF